MCAQADREQCKADRRDRREGVVAVEYTPFSPERKRSFGIQTEGTSSQVCALPLPEFTATYAASRRRLTGVLEKLEPLSEQTGLLRFLRNEDHAGLLNGFVQDMAQAVTDYQVCGRKRTSRRY